jgi:hypothetical protein
MLFIGEDLDIEYIFQRKFIYVLIYLLTKQMSLVE